MHTINYFNGALNASIRQVCLGCILPSSRCDHCRTFH